MIYSNSYFFEKALGWQSVLVEANSQNAELLQQNRPNAITVHAAMCPEENVKFQGSGAVGGVLDSMSQKHKDVWIRKQDAVTTVPCRRWGPLFKEHGITRIDIFVIDVEGGEYSVLSVMDWEVHVDYFIIEMSSSSSTETQQRIVSLLASKGYTPVSWSLKDWCTPGRDCTSNTVFSKSPRIFPVLQTVADIKLLEPQEGNNWIIDKIKQNKPFVAGRLGLNGAETCLLGQYLRGVKEMKSCAQAHYVAGIYPETSQGLREWAETYFGALMDMDKGDILASFGSEAEKFVFSRLSIPALMKNRALEPFYFDNPWSSHLRGKTVLIIHPFQASIQCQLQRQPRSVLFPNSDVLPDFAVKFVKMPQSSGTRTPHGSWLETLQYVKTQIDSQWPFDFVIISAAAYGMPLAVYCKKRHKASVVVMGGGGQILFGLKGIRWDTHSVVSKLYNKHWIYALEEDTPHDALTIEMGGAYWGPKNKRLKTCPGKPLSQSASKQRFQIHVLTMKRAKSLQRLLKSLEATEYGDGEVDLIIHVDYHADNQACIAAANEFEFSHGAKKIDIASKNRGLRDSWFDAWRPNGATAEYALILEDDIELSRDWYQWLSGAWNAYGSRDDLAGISLQRQTFVHKRGHQQFEIINDNRPFLYASVGSIGFSPHWKQWHDFLQWIDKVDVSTVDIRTPDLVTSDWFYKSDKRQMWTQYFIWFCQRHKLFTLFVNLPNRKTLASHMREPGEHTPVGMQRDFFVADRVDKMNFPSALLKYDWDAKLISDSKKIKDGSDYGGWTYDASGLNSNSIVYSVGLGEDTSWDEGIMKRFGLRVWGFDPTPKSIEYVKTNSKLDKTKFLLTPEGLGTTEGRLKFTKPKNSNFVSMRQGVRDDGGEVIEVPVNKLENWMQQFQHSHIDILKLDIEGSEYDVLEDLISRQWFPMTQLLVEFHQRFFKGDKRHEEVLRGLLSNGFEILNSENNQEISFRRSSQITQSKNTLLTQQTQDFLSKASEIQKENGFVMIQLLNEGYAEMTKSWICNVQEFEGVLNSTLFVTTDTASFHQLHEFHAGLNIVEISYNTPKEMSYGQYAYYNYMLFRTNLILLLLQNKITVWLTESDATWLSDPTDIILKTKGDYVTMSDFAPPGKMLQGGFQFLRPTPATISVWQKLRKKMQLKMQNTAIDSQMGDSGSEQIMLNNLISIEQNLKVEWLDYSLFAPGQYYSNQQYYKKPMVILNNWIIGNDSKKKRAQRWGHWYLSDDGKCKKQQNKITAALQKSKPLKGEDGDVRDYKCAIGDPVWKKIDLYQELHTFKKIYELRPGGWNVGGGGFFHYFALWCIIKALNPEIIIESGCHNGIGTWFLRQAAPNTKMIIISPNSPALYRDSMPDTEYFTSTKFRDFNKLPWHEMIPDKSKTLVFFDDHQAAVRRVQESRKFAFKYIVFDDNYVPGHGDNLSLKMVCNPEIYQLLGNPPYVYKDQFGKVAVALSTDEYKNYVKKYTDSIRVYSEFPPVWPGPNRFDLNDEVWQKITQPAIFSLSEMGMKNMSKDERDFEAKKYTHISFVELDI